MRSARLSIDKSGKWWKGTVSEDLDAYLRDYAAGGYRPDRVLHPRCDCRGLVFNVEADDDTGCARRTCSGCRTEHLMLDSSDHWEEATPEECESPCGGGGFEVAVAFAHCDDASVKWVAIGLRCVSCGTLGAYADWKIDYDPTEHLYAEV